MTSCVKCGVREAEPIGFLCEVCGQARSTGFGLPDDFESYERRHLSSQPTIARLVILDLDLADLSYDNVVGRFSKNDRPQAQTYFGRILLKVLNERFRETQESGGSYFEFSNFRRRLTDVAPLVGGDPKAPGSPQAVRVLRKALAARGVFIDPATELAHVQPNTTLYLLELYALLQTPQRAMALQALLAEPSFQWARYHDRPVLLTDLRDYQKNYLDQWFNGPPSSILEMATGTGKTVLGLAAIARLATAATGRFKVLILAPSHAICDQWRTEIRNKLGLPIGKSDYATGGFRIDVRTIQSIAMRETTADLHYDLFILDEVHHAAGPEWRKAARVPATRKLGLSATIPRESRAAVLRDELGPVIASLTLGKAKADGILPQFRWIVHAVELSPSEAAEFREQTQKITDLFRIIRDDPDTMQTVRETERRSKGRFKLVAVESVGDLLEAYEWATMMKVRRPDNWITLFGLVQARQWISHRSIPKIESAMRLLLPAVTSAKCMVTTMDIDTADTIGARLPEGTAYVVHSQMSREEQRRRIDQFKKAPTGALIAPKLLDEGIDVPDASVGFNIAGSKSRIQLVQRLGRILRPKPGKEPVFHHYITIPPKDLYVEGIDDVSYVEDLVWIKELGRHIETTPEFATPELDADFVKRVEASGYEIHARRLERERAEVELPSGSIKFEQILSSITPEAAAIIVPHLDTTRLDEGSWRRLTVELAEVGIPPGIWWLHARFREEPRELARLLQPLAATASSTPSRRDDDEHIPTSHVAIEPTGRVAEQPAPVRVDVQGESKERAASIPAGETPPVSPARVIPGAFTPNERTDSPVETVRESFIGRILRRLKR